MTATRPASAEGRWNLYRLLAEPTRLRLLALVGEEELGVGELSELLSESQPSISRHVACLRGGGLLAERRLGPRCFLRLAEAAVRDPVVADAVTEGRRLCVDEGILERIGPIVRRRAGDPKQRDDSSSCVRSYRPLTPELPVYVRVLSMIAGRRELALDVRASEGGLLDVLAPFFKRVVALEQRVAKWEQANMLLQRRRYTNVELVRAELEDREVRQRVGAGADVVIARGVLSRSDSPAVTLAALAALTLPGGQLIVMESGSMDRGKCDGWLQQQGPPLLRQAGLTLTQRLEVADRLAEQEADCTSLSWQIVCATRPVAEAG